MDDIRVGGALRAARLRRGLRQEDVAAAAGVSRGSVSRAERGHIEELSVGTLRRIAAVLDVRLELLPRSRNADLDRLVNARHSQLAESVIRWLATFAGWVVRPEVSFAWYAERGVIDLLAWHAASRTLLVIELKTAIVDVGELLGTLDRKVRLAARAAEGLGWRPVAIGALLLVEATSTNHRHVSAHAATLRAALPDDGRTVRKWLRAPEGGLRALAFHPIARQGFVRAGIRGAQRVRRPAAA